MLVHPGGEGAPLDERIAPGAVVDVSRLEVSEIVAEDDQTLTRTQNGGTAATKYALADRTSWEPRFRWDETRPSRWRSLG